LNAEKNSVLSGLAQSSPGGRRPGTAADLPTSYQRKV